jgi:hypothetical protein
MQKSTAMNLAKKQLVCDLCKHVLFGLHIKPKLTERENFYTQTGNNGNVYELKSK